MKKVNVTIQIPSEVALTFKETMVYIIITYLNFQNNYYAIRYVSAMVVNIHLHQLECNKF